MTIRILQGDCREVLKTLPDASVHCCVSSPPYWGLRSYLPDGHPEKHLEIGSEPTLQQWVETMVGVFREVRRVLKPDGTLFLNLGDGYAGSGRGGDSGSSTIHSQGSDKSITASRRSLPDFLKPKDMMGQPWRVAFALQADGWWLRQEIIWHKSNPMPESARDRCTKAHEHIFLLTKSERYFYNFDAMQEPVSGTANPRRANPEAKGEKRPGFGHGYDEAPKPRYKTPDGWDTSDGAHGTVHRKGREKGKYGPLTGQDSDGIHRAKAGLNKPGAGTKNNASMDEALSEVRDTRNPRSVWSIPTHPFKGSHFATFPPALAARCITAGCPPGGVVLDPFGGAGTVGLVADRMQRDAVLIELDSRSVEMANERITSDSPLFAEVSA